MMTTSYGRHSESMIAVLLLVMLLCTLMLVHAAGSSSTTEQETSSRKQQQQHGEKAGSSLMRIDLNDDFDPNVTEHWFDAVVDHFNFRPTAEPTFPLRYFVNDQYYQNNSSPVLFYAGNEADILQFVKNSGFLWEAAKELGAMVVFAEHRYYGNSFPFSPKRSALTPSNISYLTVEQAMADFNTLQLHMRTRWNMSRDTAFCVAGGSYGGNLALWMRLKNPNLWAGALASSATPLKHLLRESNAFNKIVADVYGSVSSECPNKIRQGWKELFEQVETKEGRDDIQRQLHLCHIPNPDSNHDTKYIAENVHGWISGALETMVQYGYPYPTNFYNPVPAFPFRVACENMLKKETNTGLGALLAAAQVYYNYTGQAGQCFDWFSTAETTSPDSTRTSSKRQHQSGSNHWNRLGQVDRVMDNDSSTLKDNANGDDDDDLTDIAWGYQCCTEVYQPMPTDGITDFELPYTPNKKNYFDRCERQWDGVTPRPDWEEMTFMSNNIQAGSNIFLSSGQLDPWRAAGIQSVPLGSHESIIVRIIENGAHHLDLRASNPLDPPSVVKVRQEELQAMRQWIAQWKEMYPGPSSPSAAVSLKQTASRETS